MTKQTQAKTEPKREAKIDAVIALLKRDQGATLDEMVKATGWLPHTTRAALTGLKKKGHTIEREQARRRDLLPHHGERLTMAKLDDQLEELEIDVESRPERPVGKAHRSPRSEGQREDAAARPRLRAAGQGARRALAQGKAAPRPGRRGEDRNDRCTPRHAARARVRRQQCTSSPSAMRGKCSGTSANGAP